MPAPLTILLADDQIPWTRMLRTTERKKRSVENLPLLSQAWMSMRHLLMIRIGSRVY